MLSVSLAGTMLEGLTSSGIMQMVSQANREIENWNIEIFGDMEKDADGNPVQKQWTIPRSDSKTIHATENSEVKSAYEKLMNNEQNQKDKARYEELSKKEYESLTESEREELNNLSRNLVTVRDGKLGEHIGYAPMFRSGKEGDELDLEKGRDYNLTDKGLGQMGAIMLDFQWNSMRASQGWAKLSLPMYDQPLWKNNGSFFEPPTLRSVSSVVMEIVGTATGQSWWISYADDLLFAAMDVGGGYKSASEVGLELAKTAATAVIGKGIGAGSNDLGDLAGKAMQGAGKVANFAVQAGISMTTNYVTSVANSAVQSLYIGENGLAFNSKNFTKSLYSTDTISGALGAGITAGLNATTIGYNNQYVTGFNSQQIGNIKTFNSLMGGLTTNTSSLLMGGNANFNLLSFKGVGMLEFSFGKDGVSSKIGMGGTNISIQNLVGAFGGATNLHKNSQINKTGYDKTTLDALRSQWGFGDEVAKDQLDDIINGDTVLKFDAEGSEVAQSVTENGQKIIHINSTLNDGFIDLGLTLQHEAHRDGIVGDEQRQYIETVNAVEAHTKMAINMVNDGLYKTLMKDIISNNQNLKDDIYLYSVSQAYQNENIFSDYVSNMYDSSNDYWKLLDDGILQKDGSGWLRDERGNFILNKYGQIIGGTGEETGLLNIMYKGTSGKSYNSFEDYQKEHSYKLMSEMLDPYYEDGKEHTKENANWDKTVVANLNMTDLMEFAGDTVTVQVFTKYYDSTVDALYADQNKIDIGEVTLRGITDNAKERFGYFMQAKSKFYESAGVLVDNKNTKITGQYKDYLFKDDGTIDITAYKNYNNKHYGIDIGRSSKNVSIKGSSILMGLSGKVILNYFDSRAGWSIHTNYGYLFEDSFINTGIFGEYDHMLNQSTVITNKLYDSDSVLGYVGNTGTASYGAHLHYSIYTIPNEYYSDSTMRILLGKNYLDSAMTNIPGTKTVYDPTQLYIINRK